MRGHVRKRGKTWSFVIDAGRDPETNKRKQRWSSGHETKKAAEKAMRKALGRLDVGADPIPEKVTVAEHAERWFQHLAAQDKPRPRGPRRLRATHPCACVAELWRPRVAQGPTRGLPSGPRRVTAGDVRRGPSANYALCCRPCSTPRSAGIS